MGKIKKLGKILLDIIEIYIPVITFTIMFLVFVIEIFSRYFFNYPISWSYEICQLFYVWTALLGACYTTRRKEHVTFDLIYEKFSPKGKLIISCIGNLLLSSAFIIAIYPSYKYILGYNTSYTPALLIPLHIGFMPFLVSIILITGHLMLEVVKNIKKIINREYENSGR
jgi:TRAP-type C4-dicarboxylate transport system permease small subunit